MPPGACLGFSINGRVLYYLVDEVVAEPADEGPTGPRRRTVIAADLLTGLWLEEEEVADLAAAAPSLNEALVVHRLGRCHDATLEVDGDLALWRAWPGGREVEVWAERGELWVHPSDAEAFLARELGDPDGAAEDLEHIVAVHSVPYGAYLVVVLRSDTAGTAFQGALVLPGPVQER